jgi:hypothetical protein
MFALLVFALSAMMGFAVLMTGAVVPVSGLLQDIASISVATWAFIAVLSATALDS